MLIEFHELNYIHLLLWSKCQEFFPMLYIDPYATKKTNASTKLRLNIVLGGQDLIDKNVKPSY